MRRTLSVHRMTETRIHRRLVAALVRDMLARGIRVTAADAPGWRRPQLVGRRRPDVVGYYHAGGAVVAGEAKRGPELWGSRPQLEEMALALPAVGPIGGYALLILGVLPEWEREAAALCSSLSLPRTASVVWTPQLS